VLRPLVESAEYTSEAYNGLCDHLGVVQSMGRVGSALDNAAAESFNSLIKVEYIHRQHFTTRDQARIKIATWITDFYNTRRRHTSAAGHPPAEFERIISTARADRIQQQQIA
jgi:transposase InsO family protein